MYTFIIRYKKGLKRQILGWFGEFESEQEAREKFPFPLNTTQIIQIIKVSSPALDAFLEGNSEDGTLHD